MNLILIGHRGSGKTTIGKQLAEDLDCDFIDTDDLLLTCYKTQTNISALMDKIGEEEFRWMEARLIQTLRCAGKVIATGGGSLDNERTAEYLLLLGKIIYLKMPYPEWEARYNQSLKSETLMQKKDYKKIYETRDIIYEQYAHHIIDTQGKVIDEIVQTIKQLGF